MKLLMIIIIIVLITLASLYKLTFDKENFGEEEPLGQPPTPYIPYIRFNNNKSRLFVE